MDQPEEEEKKIVSVKKKPSSKLSKKQSGVITEVQRKNATGFYCIGDLPFLLFYHSISKSWSKVEFSEESNYKGGLKYPSIIRLGQTDQIILTGG